MIIRNKKHGCSCTTSKRPLESLSLSHTQTPSLPPPPPLSLPLSLPLIKKKHRATGSRTRYIGLLAVKNIPTNTAPNRYLYKYIL